MSLHQCHATRCKRIIPPHLLMCKVHWQKVPPLLKSAVWRAYRTGQEITKTPSEEYMVAYRAAVNSVDEKEGQPLTFPDTAKTKGRNHERKK